MRNLTYLVRSASKLCGSPSITRNDTWGYPFTAWPWDRGFLSKLKGKQLVRLKTTSSTPTGTNTADKQETDTLQFTVNSFGKLVGNIYHKRTDILVIALDPHEYPLQDQAFIEIEGHNAQLQTTLENDVIHLSSPQCDDKNTVCIVRVTIPLKFDIDLFMKGDNGVTIQNFETHDINVKVEEGTCLLKNIKCGSVSVQSAGGDIRCEKLLQGNASLATAGQGSIFAERVQGLTFEGHTEQGDIDLHVLYADQASFSSQAGSVYVKGCQRRARVHLGSGDLTVGSLEGDLHAVLESGDVELHAAKHGDVDITTESGNIHLKLPESAATHVDIQAESRDIAEEIVIDSQQDTKRRIKGTINMHENNSSDPLQTFPQYQLSLKAPQGRVRLSCMDWLASLSLNKAWEDVD